MSDCPEFEETFKECYSDLLKKPYEIDVKSHYKNIIDTYLGKFKNSLNPYFNNKEWKWNEDLDEGVYYHANSIDAVIAIRESYLNQLEKENAELKSAFKAVSEELKESNGELEELKARLAHIESEYAKEKEVTAFYGNEKNFKVDEFLEAVTFQGITGFGDPIGDRARQRIKERKDFNTN